MLKNMNIKIISKNKKYYITNYFWKNLYFLRNVKNVCKKYSLFFYVIFIHLILLNNHFENQKLCFEKDNNKFLKSYFS